MEWVESAHDPWVIDGRDTLLNLSVLAAERNVRVLRIKVFFESVRQLAEILEHVGKMFEDIHPEITLLQVVYRSDTLTSEARTYHTRFAKQFPRVSTYFPLCLPPSPLGELARWATPDHCEGCLFREGGRCDGLGEEEVSLVEWGGGALRSTWTGFEDQLAFSHDPPLCYWWPEEHHLELMVNQLKAESCQHLWDLGGGNGYLGSILAGLVPHLDVTCVDPVAAIYPHRPEVRQCSQTAEEALNEVLIGHRNAPDALCISWPSPGRSFRSLIETLSPRILIRATDLEGVCGVRHGQYSLILTPKEAIWLRLREAGKSHERRWDDLEAPKGYRESGRLTTWTYRDFRLKSRTPTGVLVTFTRID